MKRTFMIPVVGFVLLLTVLSVTASLVPASSETGFLDAPASLWGNVTGKNGTPLQGATIKIYFYPSGGFFVQGISNMSGDYIIPNIPPGEYTVTASAKGYETTSVRLSLASSESRQLNFKLSFIADESPSMGANSCLLPAIILSIVIVVIIVVLSSLYYSKLVGRRVLDHDVRRMVYDYIRGHPGAHYRGILDELGLKMGVLTHHLGTLEREEYIKSIEDGGYRRYYLCGTRVDPYLHLDGMQKSVFDLIKTEPGIHQSQIAQRLGISRMLANYHVKRLKEKGLLRVDNVGNRVGGCYPVLQDT